MLQSQNSKLLTKEGKQILDTIDAQLFVVDKDGIVIMINKSIEELLQTKSGNIIGKSMYELFPSEDAKKYLADNQEVFDTGQPKENIIEQVKLPTGTRWLRTNKNPLFDESGNIIGIIGTAIDITEEKIAQDDLVEKKNLLTDILETTTDGILVLNTKFQFTYWNAAMEKISETPRESIIGRQQKAWNIFPHIKENNVNKLMKKAMNGEVAYRNAIPYRLKNGKQGFTSELYLPLYSKDNEIKGIIGIIRDTTEEEQMNVERQILAETANKLVTIEPENIFEFLGSTIKKLSYNSIISVNKINDDKTLEIKNIEGLTQRTINLINKLMGKRNLSTTFDEISSEAKDAFFSGHLTKIDGGLYDAFFGSVPKTICKTLEKILGVTALYSIGLRRQDKLYGSVTLALRESEETLKKEPIETIVNQASIFLEKNESYQKLETLNKNLEEEVKKRTAKIRHLLDQKDAFIHQLGHDLKTPLGPLLNLLPILQKKIPDKDCEKILRVLQRNVQYMRQLVDKTLKLAQLNSSDFELSIDKINLYEEINEAIKRNQHFLNTKNIFLHHEINPDVMINVNRLWFREIIQNLLHNAVKYSEENGTIFIQAIADENQVYITVQDNGIGIEKEYLPHLFDEYFKVDPARHDVDSSGLGLSICKKIIEKHDGEIWAESKGTGEGTKICFTLPL